MEMMSAVVSRKTSRMEPSIQVYSVTRGTWSAFASIYEGPVDWSDWQAPVPKSRRKVFRGHTSAVSAYTEAQAWLDAQMVELCGKRP